MSNNKHIFQVGFFTGISRALGFVRDVLIANIMGAGFLSDIFLTAFRLPNMFRDWLGEGALNVAFVPMFGEHKGKKSQAAYFASNAFSWLMLGLLFITILMLIFMPLVIMGIAPGFAATPDKTELTILISRIMFGYVLLVCGMAFLSGILNAYREFAIAAAMPALTNVFMIGGLLFAAVSVSVPVSVLFILSFAVLLSGIVQIIILWRRLKNRNFGLRLIRPRLTPKMKILFKRIGIGFIGTGFYQISMIVGIFIASFQVGAVSWLYYADRMVQLPFAMIGLAAGTVLLTSLSDAIKKKDLKSVYRQQNSAMTNTMMWTLPAMVGLFVLSVPIIQFIFEHGAWTHDATLATAAAISILCLVLPAMTTSQIFEKTLYANQDVKTPVKISIVSLIVSVGIKIALFESMGYLAVPVGTVIGGYLRTVLYMAACRYHGLFSMTLITARKIFVFMVLSGIMGTALWMANTGGYITGLLSLFVAIALSGIMYLPAALLIGKR